MKKRILIILFLILMCNGISASEDECMYLAKVVATELYEEPYVVKVAYCEMLLNRVKHENFPDTLPAVCFSMGIGHDKTPTENDIRAAVTAYRGNGVVNGALHYERCDKVRRTPPEKRSGVRLYDWYFY